MRPICDEQSTLSEQRGAVLYSEMSECGNRQTDSWHFGQITVKIKYYAWSGFSECEDVVLGEDVWNLGGKLLTEDWRKFDRSVHVVRRMT